jgi:hypothetical protein
MNIEEIAKRISELHYPNKPNAIIDEPYRQVRMETLRKQVETELKNCSIPAVVNCCNCNSTKIVKEDIYRCEECNCFHEKNGRQL